ncbi:MAG TPA: AsmA family protein [Candidatus Sulfotelmatobacter sp.]|nr:AsmA family protein [Candidatus Sulfotelmatobacter sp.]
MKLLSSKRRWFAAAAVLLLLLFLLRPGASRLKSRIILSISSGLGRSVDIGSVHMRLLPRPGFDLENLVVYDDSAFGAEPMLRASEVSASLRLISLLRGRLEVSRLDLTEPSLNLVRGESGHWNLEALLERAARTPLAPTAKSKSEPRSGFPYIAASSARINFKVGPEKKPYALTNADFALWQDSENAWGVRLKAQPMRTDLNLNDTGILQMNGTWQRAGALRDTPLAFDVEWDRAQIGQITKFISGFDQGWRGGVLLAVTLRGTPAKLLVSTDVSVDDFRRYDITSGEALPLAAHCDAQYSSLDRIFHDVLCSGPVKSGMITVKGSAGLPGSSHYDLLISAEDIPAAALVALARRAKKNLPEDLAATGTLRGRVACSRAGAWSTVSLDGHGEVANLHLLSAAEKNEFGPETIPFLLTSGIRKPAAKKSTGNAAVNITFPQDPHIEFGPMTVGHLAARGWASRSGYSVSVAGEAEILKTLRAARVFGLPAMQAPVDGTAQVDFQIAGGWAGWAATAAQGFTSPQVTGIAKLHNVRLPVRGATAPAEIVGGELHLSADAARLEKLNAKFANASWTGSVELPRGCGTPAACEVAFSLNTTQLSLSDIAAWVNPPRERPWYRVLQSSSSSVPLLAGLRASGHLTADHFQVHTLSANHFSAKVDLNSGKLDVTELSADFASGKYQGEWHADFTVKPAVSTSSGSFARLSLAGLALAMKDPWISGTANGTYQLKAEGASVADFWQSAEATVHFALSDGLLAHISLEDEGPLRISRMTGQAHLHDETVDAKDVKLDSPDGSYQMTGSASFKREIELKLMRSAASAGGYAITGTLAQPRVEQLSGSEQARLKSERP